MSSQSPTLQRPDSQTPNQTPDYCRDSDGEIVPIKWADAHNLFGPVLSFNVWQHQPIKLLKKINAVITDTPKTAKTIGLNELGKHYPADENPSFKLGKQSINVLFELHGAWCLSELTDRYRTKRFLNPDYIHIDAGLPEANITDTDCRVEIVNKYADYGTVGLTVPASRIGITRQTLNEFCSEHSAINWQSRRNTGLTRMARTWKTLHHWGYSYSELADAFGYNCIRGIVHDNTSDDFTPPDDPTTPRI